jgi:hypothetical protein
MRESHCCRIVRLLPLLPRRLRPHPASLKSKRCSRK